MKSRVTVLSLGAACALLACSGNDDTASPTTTATSTPSVVTTTQPPTTPPAATTAALTSPPTTALPTTLDTTLGTTSPTAPTSGTVLDPHNEPQAIQMVFQAAEGAWRTLGEALADPFNEAKYESLALYRTGDNLAGAQALVHQFRDENLRVVPYPGHVSELVIDPISLVIDPVDGFATMSVCEANMEITIQVAGNPDGTDKIIDDLLRTHDREGDYVIADGTWKRVAEREIATNEGVTSCD